MGSAWWAEWEMVQHRSVFILSVAVLGLWEPLGRSPGAPPAASSRWGGNKTALPHPWWLSRASLDSTRAHILGLTYVTRLLNYLPLTSSNGVCTFPCSLHIHPSVYFLCCRVDGERWIMFFQKLSVPTWPIWTSGSHTRGSLPLPPDSRAGFSS